MNCVGLVDKIDLVNYNSESEQLVPFPGGKHEQIEAGEVREKLKRPLHFYPKAEMIYI